MMKCLLRCEQENFSSCMIDTKTVPNKRFRSFIHYIERKCVGAYRIRPSRRRTCPFNDGIMFAANISFPLTSGRMRYAPTPVRLKSGLHWVKIQSQIDRFNHRVIIESNGKYVGAYRIRPPRRGKSTWNECVMFVVIISYSLTWGRMRYAPTPVRCFLGLTSSWQNRRNGCDDADSGYTKPSKRLRRCWLGSHKTLKTIVTTLTRVTQNPQNDRDDADSGHTKPSKRSWRRNCVHIL